MENVGQGHGGDKWDLSRSIAIVWMFIADFLKNNFSCPATYENKQIL